MIKIQNKVLELLQEIEQICSDNNINYSLCENTAIMALRDGKFTNKEYLADIMMLPEDYKTFEAAVNKMHNKSRTLESFLQNPKLDGFYGIYVNTDTTVWNMTSGNNYKSKGVFVKIHILRGKENFGKVFRVFEKMSEFNQEEFFRYRLVYGNRKMKLKALGIILARFLLRRRAISSSMMKKVLDNSSKHAGKTLRYRLDRHTTRTFDKNMFSNFGRVTFENTSLSVVSDSEKLLRALKAPKGEVVSSNHVNVRGLEIDLEIPFNQFKTEMEATGVNLKSVAQEKAKYDAFFQCVTRPAMTKADDAWRFVKRTIDRFDLCQKYIPQMEEIRTLHNEGKYDDLKEILAEYNQVTEYFNNFNMGFCFDNELFDIYCDVCKQQGRESYVKKIKKNIPVEYREDLTEYLQKQGVELF